MDVFALRDRLIAGYRDYTQSFVEVRDDRLRETLEQALDDGSFWPEPLIQLSPSFRFGATVDDLVGEGLLHRECARIFRAKKSDHDPIGKTLRLYQHQVDAIRAARRGADYVLTTGTGSGKSLSYIVPIVDHVLRQGRSGGIQAIVVYPMNALANSQHIELEKFLCPGYPTGRPPVRFARFTGQEDEETRAGIRANPPDILLTNYVMLELLLTRPHDRGIVDCAKGLRFLVFDELHTYRGRQGADVALLIRRARDRFESPQLQCVGTSATMATGSIEAQQAAVAKVASRIFGTTVAPGDVIGETLERATDGPDLDARDFLAALRGRIESPPPAHRSYEDYVDDPLARWLESTLGLAEEPGSGRLVRAMPRSLRGDTGIAAELAEFTGCDRATCSTAIRSMLLDAYRAEVAHPDTGRAPFAFRLHQFLSPGSQLWASPESPADRYVTVRGQRFVPNADRERILLPLVFCRECGQDYYAVHRVRGDRGSHFAPRELDQREAEEQHHAGFLYIADDDSWPGEGDEDALVERLPDDWAEERRGRRVVRRDRRKYLPQATRVSPLGAEGGPTDAVFLPAPFRFCLRCGVAYQFSARSDFGKLSTLMADGRSTATTILSLSTVLELRADDSLPTEARKLLSFTDNRQDAALQAGHFNDFVQVGLVRAALQKAVTRASGDGLRHEELPQAVFAALDLPFADYAIEPDLILKARAETHRVLRAVLEYRLYRDLEQGWRLTSPNLEQVGLLEVDYESLDELCRDPQYWQGRHEVLVAAAPATRVRVVRTLLDHLRQQLAIRVDCLDAQGQESLKRLSSQRLVPPWAIDETEKLERARTAVLRPKAKDDRDWVVPVTALGAFGRFLRRRDTFPDLPGPLDTKVTSEVIASLFELLPKAGLLEKVPTDRGDGYQIPASALIWRAGSGRHAFHDPLRMPQLPDGGRRANPYFVGHYRERALEARGLEAHEHTAQVTDQDRQEREGQFREAKLPILYCSPTMELGVDIAELNVVHMRNVPPTPANYAQRSGRAGRSGQPALVLTYCSSGSAHDRWFFRTPELMVAGQVTAPRVELGNEDLIRAHVDAIWIAETGADLGKSLRDVLDLEGGAAATLALKDGVRSDLSNQAARSRAHARAQRVLASIEDDLRQTGWYQDDWLAATLNGAVLRFENACERWRTLYRTAQNQADVQHQISKDASRPYAEKQRAEILRREAVAQLGLLADARRSGVDDFYSYRYFASEGFLPGYNFPRLPLSAFIPARRRRRGTRDEFLSRPRFLAITEFAPRAIIYHEGDRYRVERVLMRLDEGEIAPATGAAKHCDECGYFHDVGTDAADVCEHCGASLPPAIDKLFRLQNVGTRRVERISSVEEERQREGYEVRTGVRFADRGAGPICRTAEVRVDGALVLELVYGDSATIRRLNLGRRRRKNEHQFGFRLDIDGGRWIAESQAEAEPEFADDSPETAHHSMLVVPFVEDRKNCLLLRIPDHDGRAFLASLRAALKAAIQVEFQLEDRELAAEAIPSRDDPKRTLIYESAEGGAGVLRRLLDEPDALTRVARRALEICHYDPQSGDDQRRAAHAREDCEAACYDCLLSYGNQPDHEVVDRREVRDFLLGLTRAEVTASAAPRSRIEHALALRRLCDSELERRWLDLVDGLGLHLPDAAQQMVDACRCRPDFLYTRHQLAVYIDGPAHDFPERQDRDAAQTRCLKDLGYTVLRFHHADAWRDLLDRYPGIFGKLPAAPAAAVTRPEPTEGLDADLYDPAWLPVLRTLIERGVSVEPGIEIARAGRSLGVSVAELHADRPLTLLDAGADHAAEMAAELHERGRAALDARPTEPGLVARILNELGVQP